MAVDAKLARRRAIVERIWTWLDDCLTENEYDSYILSMNKDFPVHRARVMPLITISVGLQRLDSEVYGRLMPQKGMTVYIPFTLFVYHWKNRMDTKKSHNYDVHGLTDQIMKYIWNKSGNTVEQSTSNIIRIDDLNAIESDPIGSRALARMIVSGIIVAKRQDVA